MKQKFIEWFTKNNNGCSPAMENDRSFVHEKTQHMFEAYLAGVAEGEARCAALAAENACLMQLIDWPKQQCPTTGDVTDVEPADFIPSTSAFLAEVRAQGVEMLAEHLSGMNISASETSVRDFAAQLRKGVQS
ncbi:hypothetical protein ACOY5X_05395 [Enterobacter kobei]|uniref:hypothetical protein n=1 Tax=Enterobacter kobei TaxID=208224 RepID=UPI003BEF242B